MEVREALKRKIQAIGIKEIARRTGLAASTISRVSSGQIDPSLGSVEKIFAALGMKLLLEQADGVRPQSRRLRESLRILRRHQDELKTHGVKGLVIFGSVARGDDRPDSDLDLFVEYGPRGANAADMLRAEGLILELLPDTKVDFVTNVTTPRGRRIKEQIDLDGLRVF